MIIAGPPLYAFTIGLPEDSRFFLLEVFSAGRLVHSCKTVLVSAWFGGHVYSAGRILSFFPIFHSSGEQQSNPSAVPQCNPSFPSSFGLPYLLLWPHPHFLPCKFIFCWAAAVMDQPRPNKQKGLPRFLTRIQRQKYEVQVLQ